MAFLLKVFSGSERLKEKQKSAALVNETFQAELNDVQTKLEVENYELQMLVDMIYDSSYPESQKFLKQPSKDRLYAHKETISSLLFGLAAQGVSVAPLILTHYQKHGCDAIADTLLTLLDLVRPLLASKDAPEFTSDDILDAMDVQWHSSVRSSPAFASLRGSTAASPLQSPRVSFSNLSPRQSFSNLSPRQSFSNLSPRKSVSSPVSPYRLTQSVSFSPPSEAVLEGVRAGPASRRSLSSQYPGPEVNVERLQPLVEHEEEIGTRKQDDKDEACSREENSSADAQVHSSSLDVEFGKGLSINIPRSATSSEGEEFHGDQTHEEPQVEFSHEKFEQSVGDGDAEVLLFEGFSKNVLESEAPSCDSSNREVSEKDSVALPTKGQLHVEHSEQAVGVHSVQLEPRLEFSHDKSVGHGNAEGFSMGTAEDVRGREVVPSCSREVSEKDAASSLPTRNQFHVDDSEQSSEMIQVAGEEPKVEFSHEQSDKSVGGEVLSGGFSKDILESVVPSCDSSNQEDSEKDSVALPTKVRLHVEDSDETVGDQSAQLEPGLEFSHDKSVGDGVLSEVLSEGFSGSHEDILESEVPSSDSEKDNVALPTESQIHVEDSEQAVNVEEELNFRDNSLISKERIEEDFEGFSGGHEDLVKSERPSSCDLNHDEVSEKDVVALPINSQLHVEGLDWTILAEKFNSVDNSSISKEGMEGTSFESLDDRGASLHNTRVENCSQREQSLCRQGTKSSPWSEKSTSAQGSRGLEDNAMDIEEEIFLVTNNESSNEDGAVEFVEEYGAMGGAKNDEAVTEGVEEDGSMEDVKEEDANPLELDLIKDKEPSCSSSEAPDKEYSVEKTGVGEEEFLELSDLRSIALSRTDVLSQSSFSDHYDGEETTESSSDDETSSSDDETDDDGEIIRVEKKKQCSHARNGEHHLSRSSSSGILSHEDQALEPQLGEHVGHPDAALHSPSYNLVPFDFAKLLSSGGDKDIKGDMVVVDLEGEDSASGASSTGHALGSKVPLCEQKATPAPVSSSESETTELIHNDADLVDSGTTLDVPMGQDSNGAGLFGGEFHQRNEPSRDDSEAFSQSEEITGSGDNEVNVLGEIYSQGEGGVSALIMDSKDHLEAGKGPGAITGNVSHSAEDFQMSHNDSEVFSSVVENKFTGSRDNEVNCSGEKHARDEEEEFVPIVDSAKSEAENGAGAITRNETHSAGDFEVMTSNSQQDEGASSSEQYGLNLADELRVTNQLVSAKISDEENGGTNGSSTIDEEDRNSISDQADTEEGMSSTDVHFVKTDFQPKYVTEASPLPEELPIASASSLELESQENPGLEGVVLQSPEHDAVSLGGGGALVGHGVDEGKLEKERDLVVILPTQDIEQVLHFPVNSPSQENGSFVPTMEMHGDEDIHPSQDHEVIKGEVPKLLESYLKMKGMSTPFSEEDETRKSLVVEGCKIRNGIVGKVTNQGSVVNCEEPGMDLEPQSLEADKDVELVTGPATYGVFLHNTKFLDSQGNFERALTAPVVMARHVDTAEPERHSIRDSLLYTPESNSDGTHKNGRRRRYGFPRTWCFTCCSKPSAL